MARRETQGSPEMAILSADQLLAADDLPEKVVPVPAWGGSVRLKALTHGQMMDARKRAMVGDEIDGPRFDLEILVESMVDPELTSEQVGQLARKNYMVLQVLIAEAVALSHQDPEKAAARFPEGAVEGVGVPAGEGPGDDGHSPAEGDA